MSACFIFYTILGNFWLCHGSVYLGGSKSAGGKSLPEKVNVSAVFPKVGLKLKFFSVNPTPF